jgi:hypothetical protein
LILVGVYIGFQNSWTKRDELRLKECQELYRKSENENREFVSIIQDLFWSARDQARDWAYVERQYESVREDLQETRDRAWQKSIDIIDLRSELLMERMKSVNGIRFNHSDLPKHLEDILSCIKASTVVVYPYFCLTHEAPKEVVDTVYKQLIEFYSDRFDLMSDIDQIYEQIYSAHGWS